MSKTPLPAEIAAQMDQWRKDLIPLPRDYIKFHQKLAHTALESLAKAHRLIIHREWILDDGWLDGMWVVWAIIEEPKGRLVKLSWCDSNQEFFEHGTGSWPYRPGSLR